MMSLAEILSPEVLALEVLSPEVLSPQLGVMILLALGLDLLIGDPRWLPHPVVLMGRLTGLLERRWNCGTARQKRWRGMGLTVTVVLGTWLIAAGVLAVLSAIHPLLGNLAEILLLASCLAMRGLVGAARAVYQPLARGDLAAAREAVSHIVGRDTSQLDERGVTRACVESVAENTVDGITAPLFWAVLGGAPLALAYKAVNTLDSMVGYRNERFADFGWASARLDDAANWLPARLTALAMWWVSWGVPRLHSSGAWRATRRQAPGHPSPNSGWPEAMPANLLGIQLGGRNQYGDQISQRALMGEPRQSLCGQHIKGALTCLYAGTLGICVMLGGFILVRTLMAGGPI
ncbi:adenosylcobinamide-phosphate synthase CbiB [Halomonas cupida]|uniref:adenosylcobinamide-phosphate synthase CbiB n=1 Tax=Halomonas cupida TaxID=44933 RepID=UPI003A907D86